jgi:hypothetical protein
MQVTCPSCKQVIPAEDLNLDRLVAKCRRCNTVFDFSAEVGGDGAPRAAARRRGRVPLPPGITVSEDAPALLSADYREAARPPRQSFTIVRRWFSPTIVFMTFFCVVWDTFLIFWYSRVHGASLLFYVFPLAHVAIGVGLTYRTLCGYLNRTFIVADGDTFRLWHAPLPWPGRRELPAADLEQIYCEERVSRSNNNNSSVSYDLSAALKDGRKLRLLRGLPSSDQALFIEQCIEEKLGIVDVEVPGEIAH